MDAADGRTALGTVGLVGVLVLLLVLAVGLVRAQADQERPADLRRPSLGVDGVGWGYGWCRCNLTGDNRP